MELTLATRLFSRGKICTVEIRCAPWMAVGSGGALSRADRKSTLGDFADCRTFAIMRFRLLRLSEAPSPRAGCPSRQTFASGVCPTLRSLRYVITWWKFRGPMARERGCWHRYSRGAAADVYPACWSNGRIGCRAGCSGCPRRPSLIWNPASGLIHCPLVFTLAAAGAECKIPLSGRASRRNYLEATSSASGVASTLVAYFCVPSKLVSF